MTIHDFSQKKSHWICLHTHACNAVLAVLEHNILALFLSIAVTVAGEIFGLKSIAAYRSGLEINTNVTNNDAEEGLRQTLIGEYSVQFYFNIICFRIFFLTFLYFQLGSLSVLQTKILLTTSSYEVWKLLNLMTCQCRYTRGNE